MLAQEPQALPPSRRRNGRGGGEWLNFRDGRGEADARHAAEQRALLELQRFERIAALERRIFEHVFAAFDQVE